mmetsp:Transcript_47556/g.126981  ORF Transcript_47556/g.126981 Transcript_47556/m.126981 type:complete len:210 (-) Transcript_47556:243-872(-)
MQTVPSRTDAVLHGGGASRRLWAVRPRGFPGRRKESPRHPRARAVPDALLLGREKEGGRPGRDAGGPPGRPLGPPLQESRLRESRPAAHWQEEGVVLRDVLLVNQPWHRMLISRDMCSLAPPTARDIGFTLATNDFVGGGAEEVLFRCTDAPVLAGKSNGERLQRFARPGGPRPGPQRTARPAVHHQPHRGPALRDAQVRAQSQEQQGP